MPILPLKPIIIGTSLLVGASLAIYESHPQLRAFIDSTALKLVDLFEEVFDALDAQLRLLTPEQREERRRRQRERVRTAVLFDASGDRPGNHASSAGPDTELQNRGIHEETDQALTSRATGVDVGGADQQLVPGSSSQADADRKAKRRRLWELSESAFQVAPNASANDSAMHAAESSSTTQPLLIEPGTSTNPWNDAPPAYQPAEQQDILDDAASNSSDASSFEAINTPTSGSPSTRHSRAPSVTPSDYLDEQNFTHADELSHEMQDVYDDDDASTETMSHVSGYSFASLSNHGSGNQSEAEGFDNADVISVASSEDWENMRTS